MTVPFLNSEHLGSKEKNTTFEPQRQNNAIILLRGLGEKLNALPPAGGLTTQTVPADSDNIIALSTESFPLPAESSNILEIPWNNEKKKFAASTVVDDVDVTVRQSVAPNVANILQAWRNLVYNAQNGAVGWARDYKVDAYFVLYPPDADMGYITVYRAHGCFPSRFARGDVDHAGDDVVRIVMTLSIDKVLPVQVGPEAFTNAQQLGFTHIDLGF